MTLLPAIEVVSREGFIEVLRAEQPQLVDISLEWLQAYSTSPQTYRSYKKELLRFFLWLREEGYTSFIEISPRTFQQYHEFMRNPQPAEKWCAPRNYRKTDARWRPFEGPLSETAIVAARHALSSFFSYLVERGILSRSPVPRIRVRLTSDKSDISASKYLPDSVVTLVLTGLLTHSQKPGLKKGSAYLLRKYFVIVFLLAKGGFRREELCKSRFEHLYIQTAEGGFVTALQVKGKGAVIREVLLPPAILEVLFWLEKGIAPESLSQAAYWAMSQPRAKLIISTSLYKEVPLSGQGVYDCVRKAMRLCAKDSRLSEAERQLVLSATPHWLRRTYATSQLSRKVPVKHVQAQLGHASAATTLMYQVSDAFARWEALFVAGSLSEESFLGSLAYP